MHNHIGGLIISVLDSSVVDRGFQLQSDQTIKIVFVTSPVSTVYYGVRAKAGWLRIRMMCPSRATCLPAECFSDLALYKIPPVGLVQIEHHHHLVKMQFVLAMI
jgi:hypothetical protein